MEGVAILEFIVNAIDKYIEYVVRMTGNLAWPSVFISFFIIFRSEISDLFRRIKSYSGAGGDIRFEAELKTAIELQADKNIKNIIESCSEQDFHLSKRGRSAISLRWQHISMLIIKLADEKINLKYEKENSIQPVIQGLYEKNIISAELFKSINILWDLARTSYKNKDIIITEEMVLEYIYIQSGGERSCEGV